MSKVKSELLVTKTRLPQLPLDRVARPRLSSNIAVLSLKGKKDISGYISAFSSSNRYVLDYLAEEVLNQQTSSIKKFLLETSIPEHPWGSLCDTATKSSDSQAIMAQLEAAKLFISPLDDERYQYRCHHLFATILHE